MLNHTGSSEKGSGDGDKRTPPTEALSFRALRDEERKALRSSGSDNGLGTALCLSGGGIRSATFNLGLIQALAKKGLLSRFDYLSTVSGGGYIGAWLTSLRREKGSIEQVQDFLNDQYPQGQEPKELRHLRDYSNYLTPKVGLASPDGLVAAATGLRNFVLNGAQIWPLVLVIMLLPLAVASMTYSLDKALSDDYGQFCLLAGLGFLLLALVGQINQIHFEPADHPSHTISEEGSGRRYAIRMSVGMALLLLGWTLLLLRKGSTGDLGATATFILLWHGGAIALILLTVFALAAAGVWLTPRRCDCWKERSVSRVLRICGAALAAAAIESQLTYYTLTFAPLWQWTGRISDDHLLAGKVTVWGSLGHDRPESLSLLVFLILAYPIVLLLQVISNWVFTGTTSRLITDSSREWLARADGIQLRTAAFCGVWFALSFGSPLLGDWLFGNIATRSDPWAWLTAVSGPAISALGIWFAQSARASGQNRQANAGRAASIKDKLIDSVGGLAIPIAALLVVISFTYAGYCLLNGIRSILPGADGRAAQPPAMLSVTPRPSTTAHPAPACSVDKEPVTCVRIGLDLPNWFRAQQGWPLPIAAALLLIGWTTGRTFNVNRYSLHGFYRERLARAYLGAARATKRKPDPFTHFDGNDNFGLHDAAGRPLHIINAALNVGHTGELSWQDRKAVSFTFSPLYSGFETGSDGTEQPGAFRPTEHYAGGITLAGAIAISGAAANPNMGYHSSPAVSFLLTLFDVRLGAWLGNPVNDTTWNQTYPGKGLEVSGVFMLREAIGWLRASSPWINLSDGGHFDNLGVYEMVRRECKLIVASDASADAEGSYDDLGRTLSLIRTDFGVECDEIVPNGLPDNPTQAPSSDKRASYRRWRLFRIRYPGAHSTPDADTDLAQFSPPSAASRHGYLLYFKTVLLGDEPPDVFHYAATSPGFPHESTGDQFFSASQFESYRKLGELTLSNSFPTSASSKPDTLFEAFFDTLTGPAPETDSTNH